ncbi:unnamed protein product [Prorocentrum cordatum]|uniref:Uncharacterized protein n=1 Tax=Prorocentrum cordatum TaxID=2364126 RepID=A0ABN9VQ62_9DINO|nr:unnamed protein product [Polarella glacialis]
MPKISSSEAAWRQVWPLIRVVDLKMAEAKAKQEVAANLKILKQPGGGPGGREAQRLGALGRLLGVLFGRSAPQVRRLTGLMAASRHLQGDLLMRSMQSSEHGTPVYVCCTDETSKVIDLVLSMYTRRERVPEAEELLLCSAGTTLEQVELLLRRFISARAHGREGLLYCVGGAHLLPYAVQCGAVEALRRLRERLGFEQASALVFVSGRPDQMLTNALRQHSLAAGALPREHLSQAVSKVGELYHGRQLEAVSSELNGVGKTHHILRRVAELQASLKNQPVLNRVEIRETTDVSTLVAALLADPTSPKLPTVVHIDLAHILPSHVDSLLFELLIVGTLRDFKNCTAYHRRPEDVFLVEIPNTPGEHTAGQLSLCTLLPRRPTCAWTSTGSTWSCQRFPPARGASWSTSGRTRTSRWWARRSRP